MDIRRSIIFIGLAVVSYLLVLEWNKDYGQVKASAPAAAQQSLDSSNLSNSALPSDEFDTPEEAQQVTSNQNDKVSRNTSSVINVKTDVFDLNITTSGGNISSAYLLQYDETLGSENPLALLESNQNLYYVVESGLFGKNGFDASKNGSTPVYSATSKNFDMGEEDVLVVDLNYASDNGVQLIKRYTFERDSYQIKVDYLINNQSDQPFEANFSGKIVRDRSGDPSSQNSMGMQSYLGMVLSSKEEPYEKIDFDDMLEAPVNNQVQGGWLAFIQHYFITAWIPNDTVTQTYQSRVRNGLYLMGFISPATIVEANSEGSVGATLYVGPKIIERLEQVADRLDLTVDYGWLFFIAYPLFLLLDFLHGLVMNWGVAIILVTLCVKAVFFKLSAASYRSMANMRRVAPKLTSLKDQYGDDRQKMSQAMMELYKKEKINPLGGCLPILVQMPVFIALYWVLLESVQLRHAPFMWWIHDMSVQDPYFVLPILMGISMFVQMQLNPTPPDPMQARIMKIMPVMMTVFFLWFPSGLVLYWLVNNLLSIAQQWVITRQIENGAKS
jgi:YidC/Oxa1 family membrane protein insertase